MNAHQRRILRRRQRLQRLTPEPMPPGLVSTALSAVARMLSAPTRPDKFGSSPISLVELERFALAAGYVR